MPLPSPDTLTGFPATDSAAAALRDSLPAAVGDTLNALPADVWDAAAVYGASSSPVTSRALETAAAYNELTGNIWFSLLTLAVLGLYCLMIYLYREQILMCLKSLVNFKPEDKFTAEHGHLYNSFIVYAVVLSTLGTGMVITKLAGGAIGPAAAVMLPGWFPPLASLLVWMVVVLIITVQSGVLRAAGELTFSSKFTGLITEARNIHLAAGAVLVLPFVLLWSGSNPSWDRIIVYIIAGESAILALALLLRTFLLFVRQKVSLLIWILYLCAVEIFPIALVWALVVKNF